MRLFKNKIHNNNNSFKSEKKIKNKFYEKKKKLFLRKRNFERKIVII
jgi:hypothetical protein